LRGFRAIYLGVFFNVMIMASVNLSATKIAGVMLGWDRETAVLVGGAVTVIYAASSGLSGVVLTDFVQFVIAMIGAVLAAVVALRLPQVGGLSGLFHHPAVAGRLSLLPDFSDWRTAAAASSRPTRTNATTSRLAGSSRCFSSRSHAQCRSGSSTRHRHSRSCSRSARGRDSFSCCAGSGGASMRGASWPAWSSRSWSP